MNNTTRNMNTDQLLDIFKAKVLDEIPKLMDRIWDDMMKEYGSISDSPTEYKGRQIEKYTIPELKNIVEQLGGDVPKRSKKSVYVAEVRRLISEQKEAVAPSSEEKEKPKEEDEFVGPYKRDWWKKYGYDIKKKSSNHFGLNILYDQYILLRFDNLIRVIARIDEHEKHGLLIDELLASDVNLLKQMDAPIGDENGNLVLTEKIKTRLKRRAKEEPKFAEDYLSESEEEESEEELLEHSDLIDFTEESIKNNTKERMDLKDLQQFEI